MKPGVVIPVLLAALFAAPPALAAPEGRFDAQVFRPLAAPRDLVMVPKSEVIGHLSPVVGVYWDAALDPLALVFGGTDKALDVVGARLTVTPLFGVGLFEWAELTAAIPLVAWQTSANLRSIGTEGTVRSEPHVGDILQPKTSKEQDEINRILDPVDPDPDHDDLREPADECPNEAGPPENNGCPEPDRDGDGVIDDEDRCPDRAPGPDGFDGCPPASIRGDEIVTAKPIPFWRGLPSLSAQAEEILQEVLKVIRATPTIRLLEVSAGCEGR